MLRSTLRTLIDTWGLSTWTSDVMMPPLIFTFTNMSRIIIFVKAHMKKSSQELAMLFQALGDRPRLRLLNLMHGGEVCVCFFVEALDEPQPKISRHLAFLRKAGLVAARRDAQWMNYSIAM